MTSIETIHKPVDKKQSSKELKQKVDDHKRDNECLKEMIVHYANNELMIQEGIAAELT